MKQILCDVCAKIIKEDARLEWVYKNVKFVCVSYAYAEEAESEYKEKPDNHSFPWPFGPTSRPDCPETCPTCVHRAMRAYLCAHEAANDRTKGIEK